MCVEGEEEEAKQVEEVGYLPLWSDRKRPVLIQNLISRKSWSAEISELGCYQEYYLQCIPSARKGMEERAPNNTEIHDWVHDTNGNHLHYTMSTYLQDKSIG